MINYLLIIMRLSWWLNVVELMALGLLLYSLLFFNQSLILKKQESIFIKSVMSDFVKQLCVFGSTLSNVSVFLREVRALNRRVNFLEKTRLPIIRKLINQLLILLDEREREEIIRLKKVKELIINE